MQLKLLWELQELDLAIKEVKQKIENAPQLSGVQEAKQDKENKGQDYAELEAQLNNDRKYLKKLELQEQKIVEDRQELYESMYSGKIKSTKELEQMQRKMDLLAEDKKNVEEEILVLMESIEEQEEKLKQAEEELKESKQALKDKASSLEEELNSLNQELLKLQDDREQQAAKINKQYLDKYLIMAEKHRGKPLAKVENDICSGCRVFISSAQRGHLYNPSAMVYCENCGRLLVKLENQ
ncbi:MAG: hypothetical protein R6U91_07585 [Bacillota bacterium]